MNQIEILQKLLQNDIDRLDRESQRHKRIYRNFQTLIIALTATASIVAGSGLILPERAGKSVQFSIVCLTALSAGVTSWLEMRRARELWQHEREIYYALVDIQREVSFFGTYKNLSEADIEDYFRRASVILGSSAQKWSRIQARKTTDNFTQQTNKN